MLKCLLTSDCGSPTCVPHACACKCAWLSCTNHDVYIYISLLVNKHTCVCTCIVFCVSLCLISPSIHTHTHTHTHTRGISQLLELWCVITLKAIPADENQFFYYFYILHEQISSRLTIFFFLHVSFYKFSPISTFLLLLS